MLWEDGQIRPKVCTVWPIPPVSTDQNKYWFLIRKSNTCETFIPDIIGSGSYAPQELGMHRTHPHRFSLNKGCLRSLFWIMPRLR